MDTANLIEEAERWAKNVSESPGNGTAGEDLYGAKLLCDLAAALKASEERARKAEKTQEQLYDEWREELRVSERERDAIAAANLAANKRIVELEYERDEERRKVDALLESSALLRDERDAARAELARLTTPLASAELAQIEREHATVAANFDHDGVSPKDSAEAHRNRGVLLAEIRRLTTEAETWMRRAQGWESEAAIATERFNRLATAQPGEPLDMDCGDSSCAFAKTRGGMRTNGGCRCLENLGFCRGQTDSLRRMAAEIVSLRKRLSDLTTPRPIAEAPRNSGSQIIALWMDGDVVESMDVVVWADMDDGEHPERKFWMNMAGDSVEHMTHYLPMPEVKRPCWEPKP